MIRIVAVTFLMLVQLGGQSFCCCKLGRIAAMAPGAPNSVTTNTSPTGHGCCGNHSPLGGTERDSKSPKSPDGSHCPCQQGPGKTTAVLTADSDAAKVLRHVSDDLRTALCYLAPAGGTSLARPTHPLFEASRSPFLSTDDILHGYHILRC